jgi:E3 ubiquitin-protein ligase UBR4
LFFLQWSSSASDIGVNKGIQLVAQRYCVDCKAIYSELSKIIQSVLASRKELVHYDTHKGEEEGEGGRKEGYDGAHLASPVPSPATGPTLLKVSWCQHGVVPSPKGILV